MVVVAAAGSHLRGRPGVESSILSQWCFKTGEPAQLFVPSATLKYQIAERRAGDYDQGEW